jgi:hypothetical protein
VGAAIETIVRAITITIRCVRPEWIGQGDELIEQSDLGTLLGRVLNLTLQLVALSYELSDIH